MLCFDGARQMLRLIRVNNVAATTTLSDGDADVAYARQQVSLHPLRFSSLLGKPAAAATAALERTVIKPLGRRARGALY